jgi:hypothetical protein
MAVGRHLGAASQRQPVRRGLLAVADLYDVSLVTLDERLAKAAGQAGVGAMVPKP